MLSPRELTCAVDCCSCRPPWLLGDSTTDQPDVKTEPDSTQWSTNQAVMMGMLLMLLMVSMISAAGYFYCRLATAVPAGFTRVGRSKLLYKQMAVIGTGSNGTTVHEGRLGTQNIAVKKMLKGYYTKDTADREMQLLIQMNHINVVRYYQHEDCGEFFYLALELCPFSLNDAIRNRLGPFAPAGSDEEQDEHKSEQQESQHRSENTLSPPIRQLLSGMISGVSYLHKMRVVHRDLKPHNVLLSSCSDKPGFFTAKIADMGLGKQLGRDLSSFSPSHNSKMKGKKTAPRKRRGPFDFGEPSRSSYSIMSAGTIGWQAPEALLRSLSPDDSPTSSSDTSGSDSAQSPKDAAQTERLTRAVDIFSLGCIFYTCLEPGEHPYGSYFERQQNILKGAKDLSALQHYPRVSVGICVARFTRAIACTSLVV